MPIRITGMTSGLDTEALVSALVSAYDYKKEKYTKAQTKLSWEQDAWRGLNTKVYGFYSEVGNMRLSTAYALKKTTVSDPTKATVTASGSAVNGVQTLKIKKLARTGYLTGSKLKDDIKKDSTLADLGIKTDGKIDLKVGDETKTIEVKASDKLGDFIKKLNENGVSANFDEAQHRIFVSSSEMGASNNFEISGADSFGKSALSALGLATAESMSEPASEFAKVTRNGNEINYDIKATYDYVKDTLKAIADARKTLKEAAPTEPVEPTVPGADATTEEIDAYNAAKTQYDSDKARYDSDKASYDAKMADAQKVIDDNKAFSDYTIFSESDWDILADDPSKLENAAKSITEKINKSVKYEAEYSGAKLNILNNDEATIPQGGLDFVADKSGLAVKVEGQDAEIELNGATFVGSSNSFTINGLTIQANGVTKEGEEINITTATDTSGLYDKIKEFLGSYNNLINEMMKLYNADAAKDYEPLSDDEKAEMSDKEVEKWEQKIKDSLLRRDGTLGSLITSMTTSMMSAVNINGKDYSWGTFGISTLGFLNAEKNENYAYHIDGDSEDSKTSGKEDKLSAALASDPDTVIQFMQEMSIKLYKSIDTKMKSTAVSSVYTVYNDKEMASEYSNYSDLIKTWTKRVTELEDSYYKKFAAMEKALTTLQNSSSSLSSLLG